MPSSELDCVYTALILNDDTIYITADNIILILNSANVNVKSYWIDFFRSTVFKNKNNNVIHLFFSLKDKNDMSKLI